MKATATWCVLACVACSGGDGGARTELRVSDSGGAFEAGTGGSAAGEASASSGGASSSTGGAVADAAADASHDTTPDVIHPSAGGMMSSGGAGGFLTGGVGGTGGATGGTGGALVPTGGSGGTVDAGAPPDAGVDADTPREWPDALAFTDADDGLEHACDAPAEHVFTCDPACPPSSEQYYDWKRCTVATTCGDTDAWKWFTTPAWVDQAIILPPSEESSFGTIAVTSCVRLTTSGGRYFHWDEPEHPFECSLDMVGPECLVVKQDPDGHVLTIVTPPNSPGAWVRVESYPSGTDECYALECP